MTEEGVKIGPKYRDVLYGRLLRKPLFQNKNVLLDTFFSQFVLCHTTFRNIGRGGTDAWAVPTSVFFGGNCPPVPPKSPPMVCIFMLPLCVEDLRHKSFH